MASAISRRVEQMSRLVGSCCPGARQTAPPNPFTWPRSRIEKREPGASGRRVVVDVSESGDRISSFSSSFPSPRERCFLGDRGQRVTSTSVDMAARHAIRAFGDEGGEGDASASSCRVPALLQSLFALVSRRSPPSLSLLAFLHVLSAWGERRERNGAAPLETGQLLGVPEIRVLRGSLR